MKISWYLKMTEIQAKDFHNLSLSDTIVTVSEFQSGTSNCSLLSLREHLILRIVFCAVWREKKKKTDMSNFIRVMSLYIIEILKFSIRQYDDTADLPLRSDKKIKINVTKNLNRSTQTALLYTNLFQRKKKIKLSQNILNFIEFQGKGWMNGRSDTACITIIFIVDLILKAVCKSFQLFVHFSRKKLIDSNT